MTHDLTALLGFAGRLADTARAILAPAAEAARSYVLKSDMSPVTETDERIERHLRAMISEAYPEHGILGEEFGNVGLDREWVWVIDPIDGTKAFVAGFAVFGTLIGLAHRGAPVLGIIDNPVTGERWEGATGLPSTRNGRPIRSRDCAGLAGAFISNGNPEALDSDEMDRFSNLRSRVGGCVYGGSAMSYARIADGGLDIALDAGLDPFDYCALVPVVEGAGGVITDWEGAPLTISSGHRCLATATPDLHRAAIAALAA
ncbi:MULTISPECIES: inositol monophosphatase family protein [unclassified Haematobacter]|uniref:inositol monophosphatase family protein n=1 Tax=unclassified Haematobacter TaxID=2640585 RepID=UPI0025C6D9A6|nr:MULTISPECIES: inositol monophosphatase family protein [unclassified Haematobacter]